MTYDQLAVNIVRSINYKNDHHWNYKINLYPYNTLYFVMDGDGFVSVREQVTQLDKGYVYLIPANTLFSCWCNTHIHKLYVEVAVEVVPGYDICSSIGCVRSLPYPAGDMTKLVQANEAYTPKNLLYFKGEITRVLSEFIEPSYQIPDTGIFKFNDILNDIEQNLSCSLKVSDIAQKHGWNSTVLSRHFKKTFRRSLKSYVEMLLLNKIRKDLITTNKSLKEIAADYDFCDQYYFSSFFKKHEHTSPSNYRMKHNTRNLGD